MKQYKSPSRKYEVRNNEEMVKNVSIRFEPLTVIKLLSAVRVSDKLVVIVAIRKDSV